MTRYPSLKRRTTLLTLAGLAAGGVQAQSAGWPNRTVRMVIAFPPGGPTDIVSRVIAQQLSVQLGQSVVVDNKPGAGGNIAAELVAKAPADGYTVFYNTSAIVIGPALYSKVNYDTLKDFVPVALTASVPLVLVVNPQLPVRSVADFVAYARANPGKLNYSSSGTGTIRIWQAPCYLHSFSFRPSMSHTRAARRGWSIWPPVRRNS